MPRDCFGSNGTQLSSCLEIDDNFVVAKDESNDDNVEFFVRMYTKVAFTIIEEFEDA